MSASQSRLLEILGNLADSRGRVPSMPINELMDVTGMERTSLRSRLFELAQVGCIERLDLRAPEGETGRFRVTGKPAPEGRQVLAATSAFFDDDAIARRLKDKYGIEIAERRALAFAPTTSNSGGEHVAVSVARVRFLEGAGPWAV